MKRGGGYSRIRYTSVVMTSSACNHGRFQIIDDSFADTFVHECVTFQTLPTQSVAACRGTGSYIDYFQLEFQHNTSRIILCVTSQTVSVGEIYKLLQLFSSAVRTTAVHKKNTSIADSFAIIMKQAENFQIL